MDHAHAEIVFGELSDAGGALCVGNICKDTCTQTVIVSYRYQIKHTHIANIFYFEKSEQIK